MRTRSLSAGNSKTVKQCRDMPWSSWTRSCTASRIAISVGIANSPRGPMTALIPSAILCPCHHADRVQSACTRMESPPLGVEADLVTTHSWPGTITGPGPDPRSSLDLCHRVWACERNLEVRWGSVFVLGKVRARSLKLPPSRGDANALHRTGSLVSHLERLLNRALEGPATPVRRDPAQETSSLL